MGLPDTYDILWQCDRWLALGAPRLVPSQLYMACYEQGWKPEEVLPEVLTCWQEWSSQQAVYAESASFHRGYGWRVWDKSGVEYTSLTHLWQDMPDYLVGGVVYMGMARRILQGKDPFYLEGGLPRTCKVANDMQTTRPLTLTQPKWGCWVSDSEMAAFRRNAILAFGIELYGKS